MVTDLLSLLEYCISIYAGREPTAFRITVVAGIVLGVLCWLLSSYYTRLWNKRFRITLTHHLLCGFASVCTVVFTIVFSSLLYTRDAALTRIELWESQLKNDAGWGERTFAKAYDRVKEMGAEDFTNAPPPGSPNSIVPMNLDETKQTVASLYANEACRHFDINRPFLSKLVWSSPGVPAEMIMQDVNEWLQHNRIYPAVRAINIAGVRIKEGLDPQAPRVVSLARFSVTALFLLVQLIPFGLIGWAAYRDIKVRV
jgi:hypothetical protein